MLRVWICCMSYEYSFAHLSHLRPRARETALIYNIKKIRCIAGCCFVERTNAVLQAYCKISLSAVIEIWRLWKYTDQYISISISITIFFIELTVRVGRRCASQNYRLCNGVWRSRTSDKFRRDSRLDPDFFSFLSFSLYARAWEINPTLITRTCPLRSVGCSAKNPSAIRRFSISFF